MTTSQIENQMVGRNRSVIKTIQRKKVNNLGPEFSLSTLEGLGLNTLGLDDSFRNTQNILV